MTISSKSSAMQHRREHLPGLIEPSSISANVFTLPSSDPILWLSAKHLEGLADSDPVAVWPDASGFGNNATQSTAANKPLYRTNKVNGQPALYFDATNDSMATSLIISNPFSIFVVYAWNGGGTAFRRVLSGSNNWFMGPYTNVGGNGYKYYNNTFFNLGTVTANAWVYDSAFQTSGGATYYHSGTSGAGPTGVAPGTLYLGAAGAFGEPPDSFVAEVIAYNRALSSAEMTAMNTYLATKYAL